MATDDYTKGTTRQKTVEEDPRAPRAPDRALTATLTTDPVTFVASHVFDLGRPAVFSLACTVLSGDPDGETWATAPLADGEIAIDLVAVEWSVDNANWHAESVVFDHADPGTPVTAHLGPYAGFTARYVRVRDLRIAQDSAFTTYSGANHPSATARIDLSVG